MARLIGPDEGSRLVYTCTATGVLTGAPGQTATYYQDQAVSALADIITLAGAPIPNSQMIVDAYSRLPLFQLPDGVDLVWVVVSGGPPTPVYARTDDRLDTLATQVSGDAVVHLSGPETITGVKTFTVAPVVPAGAFPESAVAGLVGDLVGKAATTRTITAGTGLTGGGDLSADRTLAVAYGTTVGTALQGNDPAVTNPRAPSGAAGGSLAGTYPNPTIAAGAITGTEIATAIKDPAAATAGLRSLGTGAAQAVAGNDTRLSNARSPVSHASTHATGGSDPVSPVAIGAAATGHTHPESDVTNLTTDLAAKTTASDITSAISTHTGATDPHGDRVFATSRAVALAIVLGG